MKSKSILIGVTFLLAVADVAWAAGGQGGPPQKCGGADIADGPFSYAALGVAQATFSGNGGASVDTSFSVTAPSPKTDNPEVPNVFPGQGALNECATGAGADIGVLEIEKVADEYGDPLSPTVGVDLGSMLGEKISAAFAVSPIFHIFAPGESVTVGVTVSNPGFDSLDYGEYAIKLAAKADGYGIGVGPGVTFALTLAAPTLSDTTPPVVSVTKPSEDQILGVIGVEIQALDPATLVATGLYSLSAYVSSAGGTVSSLPIPLSLDTSLPTAAGVTVTGTGSFTPVGGSGSAGTTAVGAFTSASRSGIGTYTINAEATDGAGNTGYGSKTLKVDYAVAFVKQFSTPTCQSGGNGNCTGQFQFTVNRSNATSDGAFMFDQTVLVELVRTSDNMVVATHTYGTGSINSWVQIDATNLRYQTHFKREDIGALAPTAYQAKVYFLDVDSTPVLQGTSTSVSF